MAFVITIESHLETFSKQKQETKLLVLESLPPVTMTGSIKQ